MCHNYANGGLEGETNPRFDDVFDDHAACDRVCAQCHYCSCKFLFSNSACFVCPDARNTLISGAPVHTQEVPPVKTVDGPDFMKLLQSDEQVCCTTSSDPSLTRSLACTVDCWGGAKGAVRRALRQARDDARQNDAENGGILQRCDRRRENRGRHRREG